MTPPPRLSALLVLALMAGRAASQEGPAALEDLLKRGLNDESYASWRDFLLPRPEELRWQEIPWRLSLREAMTEAGKTGKPILLWAMNGHPFACT